MRRGRTAVLLVEDNPAEARLFAEALGDLPGIGVRVAGTFAEALSLLGERPDCVLLDLGLPDSAGLATLTGLMTHDPSLTVVVLTGLDDPALGEQAVAIGATDYVVKGSISPQRLDLVVRMAIRRRRAEEARGHRDTLLEMIVNRSALPDTLRAVSRAVESYADVPVRCAVLLAGPEGELHAVEGTGPDELAPVLEKLPSFWAAACCRFAPCRGTPPRSCHMLQYAPPAMAEAAARAGLHACASLPFIGRARQALGALLLLTEDAVEAERDDVEFGVAIAALAALAVERDEEHSRQAFEAVHDPLTELGNRALLLEQLRSALARTQREQEPVATVFLDLDDFKAINERLGHAIGDQVLAEVGRRIRAAVRPGDTVARYGGDEFALVVVGADPAQVRTLTERIRERVAASPVSTTRGGVEVRLSAGIAIADDPSIAPEALIDLADRDMYRHRPTAMGV